MKLYPVVHMKSNEHALELSQQAFEAGADGVFLIDHISPRVSDILTNAYNHVRSSLGREAFIGLNYLGLSPGDVVAYLAAAQAEDFIETLPDAVWSDDAVGGRDVVSYKRSLGLEAVRYLAGVAFKYTSSYTDNPIEAAILAREFAPLVDVVTTSGPGTGSAADVAKVAAMKAAIGSQELALASGVSLDNIEDYRPYVDTVLAASSIETYSYSGEFIDSKLRDLVQAAHRA